MKKISRKGEVALKGEDCLERGIVDFDRHFHKKDEIFFFRSYSCFKIRTLTKAGVFPFKKTSSAMYEELFEGFYFKEGCFLYLCH